MIYCLIFNASKRAQKFYCKKIAKIFSKVRYGSVLLPYSTLLYLYSQSLLRNKSASYTFIWHYRLAIHYIVL